METNEYERKLIKKINEWILNSRLLFIRLLLCLDKIFVCVFGERI